MGSAKRLTLFLFLAVLLFCGSLVNAAENAKAESKDVSKNGKTDASSQKPDTLSQKTDASSQKADGSSKKTDASLAKTEATEKEEPFMNAVFRDIYLARDEAFVSPRTHPYLFSFTGRWMRRRDVYQASSWPGTSVTALIFGQTCRVKVKAPVKEGIVEGHYFLASVDNGPQLLFTLPHYNASENPVFEFNIKMPELDEAISSAAQTTNVLIPHIVEIISEPNFPINLIGITIDNTIIHQGRNWLKRQNKIPTVEYISDKLPSAPPLNQSVIYNVARELHLRQEYVVTHGKCFSSECKRSQAGLAEQYTYLSPFNGNPRPQDARDPMPSKYVFHRDDALFEGKEPEFVIVDVGDNDLAHEVNSFDFMQSLQSFFGNLIVNSRPDAEIFVLIRTGRYVTETEDAIVSMHYPRLHAVKYDERRAGGDSAWHKSFYCSYILPLADSSYPYRELCGTAYEQLSAGSRVSSSAAKTVLVLLAVGSVFGMFYASRRQLVAYWSQLRGYSKISPTATTKETSSN
ncbi:hypothetical protein D0Z03_000307 [Geotrichum reessii]|nr:hypothetical protein D0Z03_000307 [Galactomyces reessii]